MLHGDLGVSTVGGRPVARQIAMRAAVTFPLIVLSLLIALAIGLPLGCAAVLTRNPRLRGLFHGIAIVGGAVPALWGGLLLILLFSVARDCWDCCPRKASRHRLGHAGKGPVLSAAAGAHHRHHSRRVHHALHACRSGGYGLIAGGGHGHGLRHDPQQAVLRVALRLATAQLVSVVGLTFAQMITGVMVVENLFALPGLGAMLVTDVGNRDLIAVQSELFLLAAFFLLLGLVVDLTHRALDPRLKHSGVVSGKAEA